MAIQGLSQKSRPSLFGNSANARKTAAKNREEIIQEADHSPLSLFTGLYSLITLPGILRNQVENFVTMGSRHLEGSPDKVDGIISLYSRFLGFFFNKFKPEPKDFLEHKTSVDPKGHMKAWTNQINPDVSENDPYDPDLPYAQRKLGIKGIWRRLIHPTTARNATSFIFGVKNILENVFSKVEHSNTAVAMFDYAKRAISSVAAVFAPPGNFVASLFSFFGKQKLVQASSLWGLTGGILMAAGSNLGSLVKTMAAANDTAGGKSFWQAIKHQGLNLGHVAQGILGGLTAIPAIPGLFARVFQIIKDTRSKLVPSARNAGNLVAQTFHKSKIFREMPIKSFEDLGESLVKNISTFARDKVLPLLEGVVNYGPLKQALFKHIMPVNNTGRVSFEVHRHILNDIINHGQVEDGEERTDKYQNFYGLPTACPYGADSSIERTKENLFMGLIPKSEILLEIFEWLGPLQAAMMMLPPIFTTLADQEVQDHGILPFRVLDRVMGLISGALAVPNYILFIISARLPQVIVSHFKRKQRREVAKGNVNYDAMHDLVRFRDRLRNMAYVPFAKHLAEMIDFDIVNNVYGKDLFTDPQKTNKLITEYYEHLAFKQEYAPEAPAAVGYIRNLMRWMINRFAWFRITVDAEHLTPAQKGKQMISGFIDKLSQIIAALPFGGLITPVLDLIKKPFNVRTFDRKKNQPEI